MSVKRPLRILISAGPTREPIDAVRFLSNYSTGHMGSLLAAEALSRGHRVTVVHGPCSESFPSGARRIPVEETAQMQDQMRRQTGRSDVVMMAAAVADFRPLRVLSGKIPRRGVRNLRLVATPDILGRLPRRTDQLRVGFALEAACVVARAGRKLRRKHLDLVLAQQLDPAQARENRARQRRSYDEANETPASPFGHHRVRAWLLQRDGPSQDLGFCSKARVARMLLDKVETLWYGQYKFRDPTTCRIANGEPRSCGLPAANPGRWWGEAGVTRMKAKQKRA